MSRVIADEALQAKLRGFAESLEICDESGRILGYFQPGPIHDREIYDRAKAEMTREELDRAAQGTEWYTTAQILEYLRGL